MNKNKIYLTLAVLSLAGMLGQYVYYETQEALALHSRNEFTIAYTSPTEARTIIQQQEVLGCSKLHQDYTVRDGTEGILTFTCDSREPPTKVLRQLTESQFIQELAVERDVEIIP